MRDQMCVDCQQTFPAAQLDMSANGWRCQKCKLRHDIDVHHGADDQVGEISLDAMRSKADGALARGIGVILVGFALAVVFWVTASSMDSYENGTRYQRRSVPRLLLIVPFVFVYGGYEIASWRRAKKAIQIIEERDGGPSVKL